VLLVLLLQQGLQGPPDLFGWGGGKGWSAHCGWTGFRCVYQSQPRHLVREAPGVARVGLRQRGEEAAVGWGD
jgi:hypothetical protein